VLATRKGGAAGGGDLRQPIRCCLHLTGVRAN